MSHEPHQSLQRGALPPVGLDPVISAVSRPDMDGVRAQVAQQG